MRVKPFHFLPAALIFFSCAVDTGLAPTRSGLSGTIYFEHDWPERTDQVMVVAATVFPPTSLEEIIMSEPLETFVDSTRYTIWTNPATYAAVGVIWKEQEQPWDVTNIIGIYFPTDDRFSPGQVTIPDRDTFVDSIDIEADLSLARRQVASAIEGRLTVAGSWPAGAQSVLLIAAKTILPTSLLDITFGAPIEAGFDSTSYALSVQPGTYRLIGALVTEKDRPIGFDSIKGIYKKKPADLLPGSVVVATDTTRVTNIDISIDFAAATLR
ncbi:hypothetical protein JXA02_11800 [candidate division KSB1 bacterium]|nr:hypothetical protein [candidate division KSB1 bacterium]RQW02112.1 MAG: hypothetical protein EH222_14130 [candidate division KSB1 bacterium]